MGKEIERKFLVDHREWEQVNKPAGKHYRQGYILTDPARTIRVRVTDTQSFLTIKGLSAGATRAEYEYSIPLREGVELLDQFAVSALSKIRYEIEYNGKLWEIDEFLDDNAGLIVAEIELVAEDELFDLPAWVSKEVTGDERYYNANLTLNPYKNWPGH